MEFKTLQKHYDFKELSKIMPLMIHEYIFKTKLQFIPLKFEVILSFSFKVLKFTSISLSLLIIWI